jgi:hypothetical protein
MPDQPTTIQAFVETAAKLVLPFATAMAAVGALSMAFIQTLKDMFPIRRAFQKKFLGDWLASKSKAADGSGSQRTDSFAAERDLIRLATASDRDAFYDLATEQLCGQINSAAQVIIEFPHKHRDLFLCLTAVAEPEDVALMLRVSEHPPPPPVPQDVIDAKGRVIHAVQRAIDGFQIAIAFRWKFWLQIASFFLSFSIVVTALWISEGTIAMNGVTFFGVIVMGIAGGFLAPVARDLVAALEKRRG